MIRALILTVFFKKGLVKYTLCKEWHRQKFPVLTQTGWTRPVGGKTVRELSLFWGSPWLTEHVFSQLRRQRLCHEIRIRQFIFNLLELRLSSIFHAPLFQIMRKTLSFWLSNAMPDYVFILSLSTYVKKVGLLVGTLFETGFYQTNYPSK